MNQRRKRRLQLERVRKSAEALSRAWKACENVTYYPGINYAGWSGANQDGGFHFGVIPHHDVGAAWYEGSEADYGEPSCPECGNPATNIDDEAVPILDDLEDDTEEDGTEWKRTENECEDYACLDCKITFGSESAYPEEPDGFYVKDSDYTAHQGQDDCDIFITQSPYFTYAQFCSPCAPGAGYLRNPCPPEHGGVKTYCFGHEMFWDTESGKAPYPVFSVKTGKLVHK